MMTGEIQRDTHFYFPTVVAVVKVPDADALNARMEQLSNSIKTNATEASQSLARASADATQSVSKASGEAVQSLNRATTDAVQAVNQTTSAATQSIVQARSTATESVAQVAGSAERNLTQLTDAATAAMNHASGNRNIQTLHLPLHGNAYQPVAAFAGQPSQTFSFRAQHPGNPTVERAVVEVVIAFVGRIVIVVIVRIGAVRTFHIGCQVLVGPADA